MIISRILASVAALSLASATWAATPDQVGTWTGSAKTSAFTPGNKTTTKQDIQIEIAANDLTTVTLGGVTQIYLAASFDTTDGLLIFGAINGTALTQVFANFNFKGTTMKGGGVGITADGSVLVNTIEAKYKLKKQ